MDLDIKLELNQFIYIITIGITWTILTFWGDSQLHRYYNVLPQFASVFITLSYSISAIIGAICLILFVWILIE